MNEEGALTGPFFFVCAPNAPYGVFIYTRF